MDLRPRETTLRSIAGCLRAHGLAKDIQVIGRAKVPIIKFVCTYGHFHVDISINQANGLQAARLVNRWLAKMPGLRPLVMVVKQLLQQRALSEVFTGGLGSYSVTLMILSFLQLHPKLQMEEIAAERNLGTLLMELLELYGKNFGYDESGITVRGLGGYFNKRKRGWYDARKPFLLCIEDPHDVGNDIAKGSFAVISVRSALGGAFDILHAALCERANDLHAFRTRQRALHDAQQQSTHTHFGDEGDSRLHITSQTKEPESLLGSVLGVSREMIKRRTEIKDLFESHALQGRLAEFPPLAKGEKRAAEEEAPKKRAKTKRAAAERDAGVRPDDAPEVEISTPQAKVRKLQPSSGASEEDSKYAAPSRTRKRQRDIYAPPAEPSDSDADLLTNDAPFVTESSDSDAPPAPAPAPAPAPEAGQGLAIAGRAKRSKSSLSKADRHAYWKGKSGAEHGVVRDSS